jgi:hypothetical protein
MATNDSTVGTSSRMPDFVLTHWGEKVLVRGYDICRSSMAPYQSPRCSRPRVAVTVRRKLGHGINVRRLLVQCPTQRFGGTFSKPRGCDSCVKSPTSPKP